MQGETNKFIPEEETIAKYTIKDSVFSDLFKIKKYLLQLYRALHPEDETATEEELMDITIKSVLTDGIYNDLGFLLGEKFMILLEAQSLWTVNIIIRALEYLAQTYHDYFERTNQNLCITETIRICKDRDVLKEYLQTREKEVVSIMMSLFDEEEIMKSFIRSERHDEARETAERLIKKGKMTLEDIAECVPSLSFDELRELEEEIMQLA